MGRSRKPLCVFRRTVGSNPTPSVGSGGSGETRSVVSNGMVSRSQGARTGRRFGTCAICVLTGWLVAVGCLIASPGPARAEGSLYPLLKRDVLIGADAWSARPRMLAAGLGFVNILGVPGADSSDLDEARAAVTGVDGAWNDGLTCNSSAEVPRRSLTSAASPAQIETAYGVPVEYGAGLPVEFSWPVRPSTVDPTDFRVTLSDGSEVTPQAASINPNFEYNERSTVVLVGQFGNALPQGVPGSSFATRVRVVRDDTPMTLVGPGGRLASAVGMQAGKDTSPYDAQASDPREWTGPRLIAGKISRMSTRGEKAPPGLRSNLPNDGTSLYGERARFRIRVLTTGGFSPDGIRALYPTEYRRFFQVRARSRSGRVVRLVRVGKTYSIDGHPIRVVGLADLGRRQRSYDYCYQEDHDNQIDILLAGSIEAARRIRSVVVPARGNGYRPFYNPGGPGLTPASGVRYTAPGPRHYQRLTRDFSGRLSVDFRPGSGRQAD